MAELPLNNLRWIGVRFQDPSGRVFEFEGEYYRAIYPDKVAHVLSLFERGIIDSLVEKGLLIETERTTLSVPGYGLVLHHRRVPFSTRGYEWCRSLIRDAGACFLDLNIELARHGLGTVDAHSGNIGQVDCCRPVWLDLGSITPNENPKLGLSEFRKCYTNPLTLMARHEMLGRLGRVVIQSGGLDDKELAALLQSDAAPETLPSAAQVEQQSSASPGIGTAIQSLFGAKNPEPPKTKKPKKPKDRTGLLQWERERLMSLKFADLSTQWGQYRVRDLLPPSYDEALKDPRTNAIHNVITTLQPRRTIDLAGNAGFFSFMAARLGAEALAVDYDEGAIEHLYHVARGTNEKLSVTAACRNVLDPPSSRDKADLVLALALAHHLSLTQGYPFSHIIKILAGYSRDALLVEFMMFGLGGTTPKPDPLPQWYSLENFIAALREEFDSVSTIDYPRPAGNSVRILLLARGRRRL